MAVLLGLLQTREVVHRNRLHVRDFLRCQVAKAIMRRHPKTSQGKLSDYCKPQGPDHSDGVIRTDQYLCGGSCPWQPRSSQWDTLCHPTSGLFSPLTQRDSRQTLPVPGSGRSARRQLCKERIPAAERAPAECTDGAWPTQCLRTTGSPLRLRELSSDVLSAEGSQPEVATLSPLSSQPCKNAGPWPSVWTGWEEGGEPRSWKTWRRRAE